MKKYSKTENVSYAFGAYATLELLKNRPTYLKRVVVSEKGMTNKGVKEIIEYAKSHEISVEYNSGWITNISGKENVYAIGVFSKFETHLSPNKDHIILMAPSDQGNLGTIVRTALGFGIENVAIIRPAADIFDPKSVRASQGSLFSVNFEYFNSFDEYAEKFPRKFYAFDLTAEKPISEAKFQGVSGLIFGNEGAGISDKVLKKADVFKISHSNKIDSLNLGVASGIVLYHYYVKRSGV